MSEQTPAELAEHAAEAVRALNHLTKWPVDGQGYEWPADVYDVVGSLAGTSFRMAQAIDHARAWLAGQGQRGRVGFDATGTDVDLPQALAGMVSAAEVARQLGAALAAAMEHAAHLTGTQSGDPS